MLPMTALPEAQFLGRLLEIYRKQDELISRALATAMNENVDRVTQEREKYLSCDYSHKCSHVNFGAFQ